jgi:hypothetical protein
MRALEVSTTYLTYSMTTAPDPVQVSPSSQTPMSATMTIVASVPRSVGTCTVSQIIITLPVGDPQRPDAGDLTDVTPSPSAASISSSDGAPWTPSAGIAPGVFVFTPPGGSVRMASQSLTILLVGIQINPLVGTADVEISEWAAAQASAPPTPQAPPSGRSIIQVAKFPYGFYAYDFASTVAQINIGDTVTLHWVGSTNATYSLAYADQPPVDIATGERTWTSPPLYTSTGFILHASASVAGQTVTLDRQAWVIVASPKVVEFVATPSQIDYNETVTLSWRATDADGVYLLTGQTQRETLAPVSDPATPKTLQPQYGQTYELQAFKTQSHGQALSEPYRLSFTFNPIVFGDFSANPPTVDLQHQSTTLTWDVKNATSAAIHDRTTQTSTTVAATGSIVEHPTGDTIYQLSATWVDGTVQFHPRSLTIKALKVGGWGPIPRLEISGSRLTVTLSFVMWNTTGGTVFNAKIVAQQFYKVGAHGERWTSPAVPPAYGVLNAQNQWIFQLAFDVPSNVLGYQDIGLLWESRFDGFQPMSSSGLAILRGFFWGGWH